MSEQATFDISDLADAQGHVEDVVVKARTSFYWAMRLLPARKRQAMFAVYAFCRVVDDIADGDLPSAAKVAKLAAWREELDRLFAGNPQHPITRALVAPVRDFGLERDAFLAIVDGMEMDARGEMIAPEMARLELYCARVAGAVGLLSVRVFGAAGPSGRELARVLGEAVQLTNVLRDLEEDAAFGRLYLPRELLNRHGIPIGRPDEVLRHGRLPEVCGDLADLAARRFGAAQSLLAGMPRVPLRPARLILVVYRRLLERLRARGFEPPLGRVSLSGFEKLWLICRYGLF
jgi:phytoene synthase